MNLIVKCYPFGCTHMLSFHFKTEVYFGLSMDWLDQLTAELNLLNAFARFKPAKTSRVFLCVIVCFALVTLSSHLATCEYHLICTWLTINTVGFCISHKKNFNWTSQHTHMPTNISPADACIYIKLVNVFIMHYMLKPVPDASPSIKSFHSTLQWSTWLNQNASVPAVLRALVLNRKFTSCSGSQLY